MTESLSSALLCTLLQHHGHGSAGRDRREQMQIAQDRYNICYFEVVFMYDKRRKTEWAAVCLYGWNVPVAYSLPCTLSDLRCLGARISLSPCLQRGKMGG